MMVLRPFIDLFRPRLDGLGTTDPCHAIRRKDPHDFIHRQLAEVVCDNQVHQVIRVRQTPTRPGCSGHLPVQAKRLNISTGGGEVFRVRSQTLDQVSIASVKRCSKAAITASDMDHQPPGDAGIFRDILRRSRSPISGAD